ncbi:MAG: hypothetical protein M1330_05280 [Armatimonadetes bacterium]|nr:hypothetical protein [Armatimonadota bacterium]
MSWSTESLAEYDRSLPAWQPFQQVEILLGHRIRYENSRYSAIVEFHSGNPFFFHVRITDQAGSTRHDWRDYHRIKVELFGHECWAAEHYPPTDNLVDSENAYHLFVFFTPMPNLLPEATNGEILADNLPDNIQRPIDSEWENAFSAESPATAVRDFEKLLALTQGGEA